GRGGHGIVFRAVDDRLDRVVALKMIRHGALAGDAERRRFLTEARAAARINYPHIIPICAVGEYAGQPYSTMELVAGGAQSAWALPNADPRPGRPRHDRRPGGFSTRSLSRVQIEARSLPPT